MAEFKDMLRQTADNQEKSKKAQLIVGVCTLEQGTRDESDVNSTFIDAALKQGMP